MSDIEAAMRFCGLFEAELLVSLMLSHWKHPRADDTELARFLLEATADVLDRANRGEKVFEDIEPGDMNFVAALWYAELCQVTDSDEVDAPLRQDWLSNVRRSLPSCFCDPDDLI